MMAGPTKSERLKRGSNPPYLGLGEAFSLVRSIYEHGGGQASRDLMSQLTGNSASSSSLIKKIGALKAYGLVIEQDDILFLTEQGNAIAAPTSERSEAAAKKAALLNVGVFSKIYERHKGKLLPADEFLRNIIEQECAIPRELSTQWVDAFKGAARTGGLIFTRPDGKVQMMESTFSTPLLDLEPVASENKQPVLPSIPDTSVSMPRNGISASPPVSASISGNITRFELSDGRVAEFSIPFGITTKDAKRLKSYLEGLKLILDSAITDSEETKT